MWTTRVRGRGGWRRWTATSRCATCCWPSPAPRWSPPTGGTRRRWRRRSDPVRLGHEPVEFLGDRLAHALVLVGVGVAGRGPPVPRVVPHRSGEQFLVLPAVARKDVRVQIAVAVAEDL